MGRGSTNRSITARGLLFGPRSRGTGPSIQLPRFKFSKKRQAVTLAKLCGTSGLVADPVAAEERFEQNGFLVVDCSDQRLGHYTISLTSDERWLDGVEISHLPDAYGGPEENLFDGGGATVSGVHDLESALRKPLKEMGFDYLEFETSGQDAIDRFERGEDIDIAAMSWSATTPLSRRESIKKRLNDFRLGLLDNNFTSSLAVEDVQQLDKMIEQLVATIDQNEDGNLLPSLIQDDLGRAVLAEMPARIQVRLMLSDQKGLSVGLPK